MERTNKPVSVITITHNREDELIRCIDSVRNQDYLGIIEHLVIGDNLLRPNIISFSNF